MHGGAAAVAGSAGAAMRQRAAAAGIGGHGPRSPRPAWSHLVGADGHCQHLHRGAALGKQVGEVDGPHAARGAKLRQAGAGGGGSSGREGSKVSRGVGRRGKSRGKGSRASWQAMAGPGAAVCASAAAGMGPAAGWKRCQPPRDMLAPAAGSHPAACQSGAAACPALAAP